jgi:hypothetical protein
LWFIKVLFSASTFVVKNATFAKRQTVSKHAKTVTMEKYVILKTENRKKEPP